MSLLYFDWLFVQAVSASSTERWDLLLSCAHVLTYAHNWLVFNFIMVKEDKDPVCVSFGEDNFRLTRKLLRLVYIKEGLYI